jgi:hypothetical protein
VRTKLQYSVASASLPTRAKSGFQGVYLHKHRGNWCWDVTWRGERMSGSGFASAEAAAAARAKAIKARWPDRIAMTK